LARSQAKTFAEGEAKASAHEIKACLTAQHKVLSAIDRAWKVEMNFWLHQRGLTGEKRLVEQVYDVFPTQTKELAMATSLQVIANVAESRLYQFMTTGLQAEIMAARG
jgi:hypothetical protein